MQTAACRSAHQADSREAHPNVKVTTTMYWKENTRI